MSATDQRPDLTKDAVLAPADDELRKQIIQRLWQPFRFAGLRDGRSIGSWQADALLPMIAARIAQARAEEREACAQIAETGAQLSPKHVVVGSKHIAAAIRARKETTND